VKGRYGKFVFEMCANLNFVSRQEKTKMETTAEKA
jgi:hypothetical protein